MVAFGSGVILLESLGKDLEMTTIILINAILGAAVLATVLAIAGWAIKHQRHDYVQLVIAASDPHPAHVAVRRARSSDRRELAHLLG